MSTDSKPSHEDLALALSMGNQASFDQMLADRGGITREDLQWASKIADIHPDVSMRLLGAIYWVTSDLPFEADDEQHLQQMMAGETDERVYYRYAIALYKRGNRDAAVIENFWIAYNRLDFKELAAKYQ